MNYRTLPNGDTVGSTDELPQMLEAEEGLPPKAHTVYDDNAPPDPKNGSPGHNPTIGYGINLRNSAGAANLALVLNQIQYNGVNVFTQAATYGLTPATVVGAFETIIGQFPSATYPSAAALETALSTELGSYFGLTASQSSGLFYLSTAQAQTILGQMVNGYSIPGYSALSIYQQLTNYLTAHGVSAGNVPPITSSEALALCDMFFNSQSLIGPKLRAALQDGNRAQVWYQIRYGSNANALTTQTLLQDGIAKRRYYESQIFGLSSSTDNWQQAYQNYEMLMEDRASILAYEERYGESPSASPSSTDEIAAANGNYSLSGGASAPVSQVVQNLSQSFAPDALEVASEINSWYSNLVPTVGIQGYSSGAFQVQATNILVAPDSVDIADGFATAADQNISAPDALSSNQILIGPDYASVTGYMAPITLTGGNGNDLLIAGAGNEDLYGGLQGNDTLIGGQGLPSSIAGAAGYDVLYGGDGKDTFDFALPSSTTVSETIVPGLLTTGVIEVSNNGNTPVILGGSASSPLPVSGAGGAISWSGTGSVSDFLYTLNPVSDALNITNTAPVASGGMGGNSIVIDNFNLAAAESATGYLGIFLSNSALVVQGANNAIDPPIANFVQGSSDSFTYGIGAPFLTPQTITVTLSGAEPSDFVVSTTNGIESISSNGAFTLTLAAGATSTSFTLVDATRDNGSSDIAAGATLQLAASMPNPVSGDAPIQTSPITFNYASTSWNTDGEQQPTDGLTGIANGGGTGVTLYTGDGANDSVSATTADNLIELQTSGNDSIIAGASANSIYGGQGNDIIAGSGGVDIILTGDGDSEIYGGTKTNLATAISNAGAASATGEQGDFIGVQDGNNTIVGGNGNDAITAGAGDDLVVLGPGDDVFMGGWESTAVQDNWAASVTGLSVSLDNTTLQLGDYTNTYDQPYNGTIQETIADGETTTSPAGAGNDTVFGGKGNDYIGLGNGDNYVDVGSGNSTVLGGMGDDTIIAGSGTDYIKGGGGNTFIYGGAGADSIFGGDGSNTIIGGSGNATIYSSTYYDTVTGTYSTNFASANADQNYVTGGSGNDLIIGSQGQDTLIAGTGNTEIQGGSGAEYIVGGSGLDTLFSGTGSDTISAGTGNTAIQVEATASSTTIVYGGEGKDSINGGSGTNILFAGDGGTVTGATSVYASETDSTSQTTIYGGAGIELLEGGLGSTVIYGGNGGTTSAPVSILGYGSGSDTFYGGDGTDLIVGGSGSNVLYAGDGGTETAPTSVDGGAGISTLYGGAGSTILQDTVSGEDLLVSQSGDDTLIGMGADTLVAGTGDDVFEVDGGSVTVDLSAVSGNDNVYTNDGGEVNLSFGVGVELADVTGSIGEDSAGNWYLDLSDDGVTAAVEGALTGSLANVTYADTGSVSMATLLDDAIGGDEVFTSGSSNFWLQLNNAESLTAGPYQDTISSWGSDDTIQGGSNDVGDAIIVGGASASISSGTGGDSVNAMGTQATINGSVGDQITVSGANSLVNTLVGNETVTASGSNDTLIAGSGNFAFHVNNASTVVEVSLSGGNNSVVSSVSYTAPTNVNALTLSGSANLVATGNSASDTLTSGAGVDTLVAGSAVDTLLGSTGNTTFVVNNTGDVVRDSSATASNTLDSSVNYTLPTDVNALVLTGSANLVATANAASDTLTSNSGVDTLIGGSGNDTFVINNAADVIVAGSGETAVVFQFGNAYTLPSGVNSLILSGSANLSVAANSGNDTLVSNLGVDTLTGGSGNDTFVVNNPNDVVADTSAASTNVLESSVTYTLPSDVNTLTLIGSPAISGTGNAAANVLTAGTGLDTLVAGSGVATLDGGTGNDTFVVNNTADVVHDTSTTASNSVQSSVSYSLGSNINTLTLTGATAVVGIANGANDTLSSNSAADTLVGGSGSDTFVVNNGNDVIEDSSTTASNVIDSAVSFTLPTNVNTLILTGTGNLSATSNSGRDYLEGGAGQDTLVSTVGQDTLVAGAGIATLVGGSAAELFVLNNSADLVTVTGGGGADTIESSESYTLPSVVGVLILTGSESLAATAISGNNSLVGNAGNDTLYAGSGQTTLVAGAGPDTLVAGGGVDTFVINSASDVLASVSGSSGDAMLSSVSYTLSAGLTTLTLTGAGDLEGMGGATGSDTLSANSGNDTLIAGSGPTQLNGGIGADLFEINSSADIVDAVPYSEKPAVDTIESSVSYTLPSAVNDLILSGTSALVASGNGNADSIMGNAGADTLKAGTGNDTLVAGIGLATLLGGAGNDTFIINNPGDVVQDSAGGANNVLIASAAYTLPTDVNTLLLIGSAGLVATANGAADSMQGNAGADTLVAGSSNDTLDAGAGIDTFVGGAGNDTFIVNSAVDVIEDASSGTTNVVLASSSFSLPTNVDVLALTGIANSTGTANSASDTLTAGAGSDTLVAGLAADTLIGGSGNTTFVVNSVGDMVEDSSTITSNTVQSSVAFTLVDNVNTLVLTGTTALVGAANSASDTLFDNGAADTLVGSVGNETFVVSNTADVVLDTSTTANNMIESSVSYSLSANINTLELTGSANLVGTANAANDTLVSNSGVDTLIGGGGNDVFVLANPGDVVEDSASAASNSIQTSASYTLPTNVNALLLTGSLALTATGNGAADLMMANSGNSTLVAGTGAATLIGGTGNDTFVVDSTADVVRDSAPTTSNTLESSVNYSLPTDVTTLVLTGTANLTGGANGANDTLISNSGIDTLVGGAGSDLFIVNNSADVLQNLNGNDTVESYANYSLPSGVNQLLLVGSANVSGTGNGTSDTITAGAEGDTLVAGSAVSTLIGGTGSDTFVVDNSADVVIDTDDTIGNSVVSSVSYSLPVDVDTLTLSGTGALTASGNADTNNVLTANSGNDVLVATAWNTTINGGSGMDTIDAGPGDNLIYAGNGGIAYGPTYVYGNAAAAEVYTSSTIYGGSGTDAIYGGPGSDDIITGSGSDTVYAGSGYETVDGASGTNTLYGGAGTSLIYGGAGTAFIYADGPGANAQSQNTIYGGSGTGHIFGGPGSDAIYAGEGDASLYAGTGVDSLYGDTTGDVLNDQQSGQSLLVAGAGAETLNGFGGDTLVGGSGADLLYDQSDSATGSTYEFGPGFGQETIGNDSPSNDTLASSLNDTLEFGAGISSGALTVSAPEVGDYYSDFSFGLLLSDGAGSILVNGGLNPGVISTVEFSGSGAETFDQFMNSAGPGAETIGAGGGLESLLETGNDQVISTASDPSLWGIWAFGNDDVITDPRYSDAAQIVAYGNDDTVSGYNVWAVGNGEDIILGATNYGDGYATLSGANDTLSFAGGYADFVVDQSSDIVQVAASTGVDSIDALASYSLPTNVQFLTLDSTVGGISALSNAEGGTLIAAATHDTLTGGSGADTLIAQTTNDVLVGGSGSETYELNSTSDSIDFGTGPASLNAIQANFSYTLPSAANSLTVTGSSDSAVGNSANDLLTGTGTYDTIVAGAGNDTLVAASTISGATLHGGTGNDTFVVGDAADVIQDSSPTSTNILESSVNYTLPTDVNTLLLTGVNNISGTGNSANDLISANNANDTVVAGAGNDTLTAGAGVDTFVLNSGFGDDLITNVQNGDVIDFGPGISLGSLVFTAMAPSGGVAPSLLISDGSEVVTVQGGVVPDAVGSVSVSGSGSYTVPQLVAPSGQATVNGVGGNLILTSAASASVTGGTGDDTIAAWGNNDTLNAGTGGALIYAGGANDLVNGSAASDTLTSIGSGDTLTGGSGVETFIVNNTVTTVDETTSSNEDRVLTSVNFTLPTNVATLLLTGTAALQGTGNSGSDVITGNTGRDTLVSGSGLDTLVGGSGPDTFVINNSGDIIQNSGGYAEDTVEAAVSYTLPTGLLLLEAVGAGVTATGNAQNDELISYAEDATLQGGSGSDTLVSEANDDEVIAGSGNDYLGSGDGYSNLVSGTGVDTLSSTYQYDGLEIKGLQEVVWVKVDHFLIKAWAACR